MTEQEGAGGTNRRRLLVWALLAAVLTGCSQPEPTPEPTPAPTTPARAPRPPPLPPPDTDETDPDLVDERAKIWTKYAEKRHGFPFLDLRYYVDAAKLDDFRWSQQAVDNRDTKSGAQLVCRWTDPKRPTALAIEVVVLKHPHEDEEATDVLRVLEGHYEDWRRAATAIVEGASLKPRKRKAGLAKIWAAVSATNPETGEREYRVWYGWKGDKDAATYVCRVRVGDPYLEQEHMLDRGDDLVKSIKEIREKIR